MNFVKGARQLLRRYRYAWGNRGFVPHVANLIVNDESLRFQIADIVGKQWYEDTSPRDDAELRFICDHVLQPGQKIVDCGAHHGLFAVVFARRVGAQGRVLAFEPSALSAQTCRTNAQLNGLENIEVVEAAVSDMAGKVSTTGDSNLEILAVPINSSQVDTVVLDDFLDFAPDVIKIDIEGYEVQALRGMRSTIAKHRPHLLVEVHTDLLENYGTSVGDVLEFMPAEHYDVWIQWATDSPPVVFNRDEVIARRVHLFALCRDRQRQAVDSAH